MRPLLARCLVGVAVFLALVWHGLERSYPLLSNPLALTLTLPPGVAGRLGPLVTTGQRGAGDLLYLRYVNASTVVFGYDSWGRSGPESAPIAFVPGTPYPLIINLPSLAAAGRVDRQARGPLRIVYAGREVLQGSVRFHGRAPHEVYFATNPIGGTVANSTLSGLVLTADGRRLAGRPSALFPWTFRLQLWRAAHPWAVYVALAAGVTGGWLAPWVFRLAVLAATALTPRVSRLLQRIGVREWCHPPDPVVTGNPRPPHLTFVLTAAVCTGAFFTVITGFTFRLLEAESFGMFYDYQAAGLLAGRLDVPAEALSGEAFVFQGKYYGYFGPTPALLRLPLALTGQGFGRLSRSFMVVDYVACLAAVYALLIHAARRLSRRATWPARADVILLVGSAGLGSTLFFVGSRAYVYHEAILCGAAFALWGAWSCLRWLAEPTRHRWWILALGCGVLAVHSRPPVGLFALALLGCTAATLLGRAWSTAPRAAWTAGRTPVLVGGLAVLGVLSFSGLSYLKFKSFEGVPLKYHVQYSAERLAVIEGRNFHLGNLPFGFDSYVWLPDFSVRPMFPYFYLQSRGPVHYQSARIDQVEHTLALPYAMPALVFLAGLAGVLAVGRWPAARLPLAVLAAGTIPMAVALFAAVAISHRYTADFAPSLLTAAAFGLTGLAALPPLPRRLLYAITALLSVAALGVTLAVTLHFQGEGVWGVPAEVKAHYLMFRQHMDHFLGFSRP